MLPGFGWAGSTQKQQVRLSFLCAESGARWATVRGLTFSSTHTKTLIWAVSLLLYRPFSRCQLKAACLMSQLASTCTDTVPCLCSLCHMCVCTDVFGSATIDPRRNKAERKWYGVLSLIQNTSPSSCLSWLVCLGVFYMFISIMLLKCVMWLILPRATACSHVSVHWTSGSEPCPKYLTLRPFGTCITTLLPRGLKVAVTLQILFCTVCGSSQSLPPTELTKMALYGTRNASLHSIARDPLWDIYMWVLLNLLTALSPQILQPSHPHSCLRA